MLGGRPREPRKRASDLYDLYRLVLEYDRAGGIGDALGRLRRSASDTSSPTLCARVIDEPERAVRWLLDGGPDMSAVTADDLRDVLGPLIGRLTC